MCMKACEFSKKFILQVVYLKFLTHFQERPWFRRSCLRVFIWIVSLFSGTKFGKISCKWKRLHIYSNEYFSYNWMKSNILLLLLLLLLFFFFFFCTQRSSFDSLELWIFHLCINENLWSVNAERLFQLKDYF